MNIVHLQQELFPFVFDDPPLFVQCEANPLKKPTGKLCLGKRVYKSKSGAFESIYGRHERKKDEKAQQVVRQLDLCSCCFTIKRASTT